MKPSIDRSAVRGQCDIFTVGAGPKALAALADLESALAAGPGTGRPPRIVACDVFPPGAGAVWRTDQPRHLLMNVRADIVDMSSPSVGSSFREWECRSQPAHQVEPHPPRARVGEYLAWAFERLCASPLFGLSHVRGRVDRITPAGDRWRIDVMTPAGCRVWHSPVVVICTGHADAGGLNHADVVSDQQLAPPGGDITVLGAALTAYDVVLDLTEGRGGRFETVEPGRMRFHPGGGEPRTITLVSRSGTLMTPKPQSDQTEMGLAVTAVTHALRGMVDPDDHWWQVLAEGAMAAARSTGVEVTQHTLMGALDRSADGAGAFQRLRYGIEQALGTVDQDPCWWWGRVWALGYRDIVASLERRQRRQPNWLRWRSRAARMERWAFGPPIGTATRLLALHEAGILQVAAVPNADEAQFHAITAPPGILTAPAEESATPPAHGAPWNSLLDEGLITVRPGERGVLTGPDAVCLTATREPSTGLSALGRPTEDPVIGHDTLNRGLHADSRRWAAAVARWLRGATEAVARTPFVNHDGEPT